MTKYIIAAAMCLGSVTGFSQSKDSLLANERTLDRPLNVHGGQLRVTGSYGFGYVSRRYENGGNAVNLVDKGFGHALHNGLAEIKFGIMEHLQLTAILQYETRLRRDQKYQIGHIGDQSWTFVKGTERIGGMRDPYIGLDFRLPFKTRKVDVMVSGGSFLPLARSVEPQPEHSYNQIYSDREIVYRRYTPVGYGVAVAAVGGAVKYRLQNFGITASAMHYHAFSPETEGIDYSHRLLPNNSFEYESSSYKKGVPDMLMISAMLEYQASPFFNLFLHAQYSQATKGWREWEGGKMSAYNNQLVNGGVGFELIITPRIWFREAFTLPVKGEDIESGVSFQTSLSYNLFVTK